MERVLLLLICFLLLSQPNNCSSSLSFNSSTPLCHSDQSSALLHFRNSFSVGDYSYSDCGSYPPKNSWKMGTDCCGWDGVTCDTMTGHVVAVDLSCSGLEGPIHPNTTLFSLRHLQRLNLAYNDFHGSTISSKFGGFANMTHLNLAGSSVTGSSFAGNVPSEISHLSKLVSLDLSMNVGIIMKTPSLKRLVQNLTHLTELFLDEVNMSSVSPNSFMNLSSSLTSLRLGNCQLKGRLPDNIFHLPNLQLLDVGYNHNLTGSLPTYNWSTPLKSLDLSYNNFGGQCPSSLLNNAGLTYLDLSHNNFIGQLPDLSTNRTQVSSSNSSSNSQSVSQIPSNLVYLILSDNLLNGTIPSWLYDIPSLQYLALDNNQLTGQIDEFHHNSLKYLYLSNNNLHGHLPISIAKLVNLLLLDISFNNLSGSVEPNIFTMLKSLELVDLSHNNLQGHLPISISKLVSLFRLDISFNNLSGSVEPNIFSRLNSLKEVVLSHNNLQGHLPISISKLVSLFRLDISFNNLSGSVEQNIFTKLQSLSEVDLSHNPLLSFHTYSYNIVDYTLPELQSLSLSSCNISEFPYFLKSTENLVSLDLSNNQINGSIPTWLLEVKMDSLRDLNLSNNSLARIGNLPWKNLKVLDLHSNLLEGPLPVPPLHTYFFSVSRNNLTGEIPLLICNLSSLHYLDLSYNRLSNMIPPCLGNLSNHLKDLDLQSNNLHGTIPSTFAKGCYLRSLKLNGNRLEGSLPQSLVHCRKLEVLDFGNNKINGTFPLWLENLPKLQVLILRSNNFHGAIGNPKYKFPFPNLRIIDLSYNEFHGLLPTNFFKYLKAMKNSNADKGGLKYMGDHYYQDSVIVAMKGKLIKLVKIQSLFTTIDFSNNDFKGEIPKSIGELGSLKGLNFSHNNLIGCVPPSLGNLTNLEWLDLSSNKLEGEIPIQLVDLTSLAVLNLSENHLFGQIPQGKQFNTFTNDSYNGNLGLCGFPMTKACGNDEGQQLLPSSTTQEDDFKFENGFNWKVVLLGYSCGFMFGLGLGYLVFSSGKPKWLVNIVYGEQDNKVRRSKKNAHRRTH